MVDIIRDNISFRNSISLEIKSLFAKICPVKKVITTRVVISDEDLKARREFHAFLTRDVAYGTITEETANRQIELDDRRYFRRTTHWALRKFW